MIVNGYTLENDSKVERAARGTVLERGRLSGGVGKFDEDNKLTNPEDVIAEYDRLGGLITKDGVKVKTGSFYDFNARHPHKKPEVVLLYNVGGDIVEVKEGDKTPGIVEAAQVLEKEKKAKETKKAKAD